MVIASNNKKSVMLGLLVCALGISVSSSADARKANRQGTYVGLGYPNPTPSITVMPRNTPKTNGKAERFIQTSLRERAYARAYNTSNERTPELPRWLHRYNWHRPHGSIGSMPPISRLGLTGTTC